MYVYLIAEDTRLSTSAPLPWARGVEGSAGEVERSPTAKSLSTQPSFPGMARPRLDSDVGPSLSAAGSQTLSEYRTQLLLILFSC